MSDVSQAFFLLSLGPETVWHPLSKVIVISKVKKEAKKKTYLGLGCDMGMGHTMVLGSQVSQVQVWFQKYGPEATP